MGSGIIIDCDYIIRVKDYHESDLEFANIPIISIDTGLWDFGE